MDFDEEVRLVTAEENVEMYAELLLEYAEECYRLACVIEELEVRFSG